MSNVPKQYLNFVKEYLNHLTLLYQDQDLIKSIYDYKNEVKGREEAYMQILSENEQEEKEYIDSFNQECNDLTYYCILISIASYLDIPELPIILREMIVKNMVDLAKEGELETDCDIPNDVIVNVLLPELNNILYNNSKEIYSDSNLYNRYCISGIRNFKFTDNRLHLVINYQYVLDWYNDQWNKSLDLEFSHLEVIGNKLIEIRDNDEGYGGESGYIYIYTFINSEWVSINTNQNIIPENNYIVEKDFIHVSSQNDNHWCDDLIISTDDNWESIIIKEFNQGDTTFNNGRGAWINFVTKINDSIFLNVEDDNGDKVITEFNKINGNFVSVGQLDREVSIIKDISSDKFIATRSGELFVFNKINGTWVRSEAISCDGNAKFITDDIILISTYRKPVKIFKFISNKWVKVKEFISDSLIYQMDIRVIHENVLLNIGGKIKIYNLDFDLINQINVNVGHTWNVIDDEIYYPNEGTLYKISLPIFDNEKFQMSDLTVNKLLYIMYLYFYNGQHNNDQQILSTFSPINQFLLTETFE